MRGWVKAEEVTPGKWWQIRDGTLRRREPSGESISFVREGDLFWKRGRPLPDDNRWLPASAAIAEWEEQGGSKGWWVKYRDEPIYKCTAGATCFEFDTFLIPAGKPPLPKESQAEQFDKMQRPGWLQCKRCLSSMLEANAKTHVCNPAHAVDTGPRMVPVCMIPLETHRKRLEELAVTAHRALGHVAALNTNERTHEAESWLDDALTHLLEVK